LDADRVQMLWRSASPATRLRIKAHAQETGQPLESAKEAAGAALETAAANGDASASEQIAALEEAEQAQLRERAAPKVVIQRGGISQDLRVRLSARDKKLILRIQRSMDLPFSAIVRLALRQYYVELFEGQDAPPGRAIEVR
jgi:hypothetical protein